MSEQPQTAPPGVTPFEPDEEAPVRQAPQEPLSQPVAGGADDGPPAQGEGAPDSH